MNLSKIASNRTTREAHKRTLKEIGDSASVNNAFDPNRKDKIGDLTNAQIYAKNKSELTNLNTGREPSPTLKDVEKARNNRFHKGVSTSIRENPREKIKKPLDFSIPLTDRLSTFKKEKIRKVEAQESLDEARRVYAEISKKNADAKRARDALDAIAADAKKANDAKKASKAFKIKAGVGVGLTGLGLYGVKKYIDSGSSNQAYGQTKGK